MLIHENWRDVGVSTSRQDGCGEPGRYTWNVPKVIIIAGPNGAGKTTFAGEFLPAELNLRQFVNADLIAAGISPYAPDTAEIAAGRALLRRLDELILREESFVVETTLSGTWLVKRIKDWQSRGYIVVIIYVTLSNPEMAINRVAKRILLGGHAIPMPVIVRRFWRSQTLFNDIYKALVNDWIVYDNSGEVPRFESRKP